MMKVALSVAVATTSLFSAAHADETRIAELKEEIRAISLENLGRRDNLSQTRAELNPLVEELGQYHNPPSAASDLDLLEGAWKEIFSDDVEPEPPGFSTDRDTTYQVVTTEGYFYNLANLKGFVTVLGVLRGVYTPAGNDLNIEFTDVKVRAGGLRERENLVELTQRIESGNVFLVSPPGDNTEPNGPVGAKGRIRNIYIDGDFRVGLGANYRDGVEDLFVLDRVENPIRYVD